MTGLEGLLSFNSTSGGSSYSAMRLAFLIHIVLQKASLIMITEKVIKASLMKKIVSNGSGHVRILVLTNAN